MKETKKGIKAVVFAGKQNPKFFLIKRKSEERGKLPFWKLVAGRTLKGEESEATALRELKEETNLDGKIFAKLPKTFTYTYRGHKTKREAFLIKANPRQKPKLEKQFLDFAWANAEQSFNLLQKPYDKKIFKKAIEFLKVIG
ncbi:NUDIX domain-containing protein [archaeon]|nr:NUDIX domain-containing protein [archaeon]